MAQDFRVGGLKHMVADISADGDMLYFGVLNDSDQPEILVMSADLDADAVSTYTPGAGTVANVACGDLTDLVYGAGDFGGPRVVRQSYFLGVYWADIDESTYWTGTAQPLVVGPGEDQLVLTFIDDVLEMRETYFIAEGGPYWLTLDEDTPFQVASAARLSIDWNQIMIGTYFYSGDYEVYFTPNSGFEWEDISLALLGLNQTVTSLIFNFRG